MALKLGVGRGGAQWVWAWVFTVAVLLFGSGALAQSSLGALQNLSVTGAREIIDYSEGRPWQSNAANAGHAREHVPGPAVDPRDLATQRAGRRTTTFAVHGEGEMVLRDIVRQHAGDISRLADGATHSGRSRLPFPVQGFDFVPGANGQPPVLRRVTFTEVSWSIGRDASGRLHLTHFSPQVTATPSAIPLVTRVAAPPTVETPLVNPPPPSGERPATARPGAGAPAPCETPAAPPPAPRAAAPARTGLGGRAATRAAAAEGIGGAALGIAADDAAEWLFPQAAANRGLTGQIQRDLEEREYQRRELARWNAGRPTAAHFPTFAALQEHLAWARRNGYDIDDRNARIAARPTVSFPDAAFEAPPPPPTPAEIRGGEIARYARSTTSDRSHLTGPAGDEARRLLAGSTPPAPAALPTSGTPGQRLVAAAEASRRALIQRTVRSGHGTATNCATCHAGF